MSKIPDDFTLQALCVQAAQALAKAGMQHRIDIYRDVEVDDPTVRKMLGRSHKVRVRVKITATSLLFESDEPAGGAAAKQDELSEVQVHSSGAGEGPDALRAPTLRHLLVRNRHEV